ncbi:hypothetical protein ACFXHA_32215 [Nocardia sp. NPDC059240]|uniref:hypothetical protein n=1 Tax=Nocardia sp. NPDC059240 TaxID=3346786 RepID=UPI0036BAA0C1
MTAILRSDDRLPEGWKLLTAKLIFGVALVTGFAIFTGIVAVTSAAAGEWVKAGLTAAFAVSAGLLVYGVLTSFFYRRHGFAGGVAIDSTGPDGPGTVLRAGRLGGLLFLAIPALPIALGWWGILKLQDRLPWSDGGLFHSRVFGVIALIFAVYPVVVGVEFLRGGFRTVRITLTPSGLRYRAMAFEMFIPWTRISAVGPAVAARPGTNRPSIMVAFTDGPDVCRSESSRLGRRLDGYPQPDPTDGTAVLRIAAFALDIGGVRTLSTLTFYAEHPEARRELGTADSISRITG